MRGLRDIIVPGGASGGTASTVGDGGVGISASGSVVSAGTVVFSNANGVSFGLSRSTVTATVATNYQSPGAYLTTAQPIGAYLTTAALSQDSSKYAGLGSSLGTVAGTDLGLTVNTNGVSIVYPKWLTTAQSPGAYLTTAALSGDSSKYAGIGFTTTTIAGSVVAGTHDTNGLKLAVPAFLTTAQSPGAYLTTAALSQDSSKYAGINGAITGGSLTINTSGISINLPVYLTTAALSQDSSKYAGLNSAITGGSLTVNTSGISINLPAYLTTAMASNAGSNFIAASAVFNGTNISGTLASNAINLSVAAPGGGAAATFSAGTSSGSLNSLVFSNASGVSFGLSGSTLTASVKTDYQTAGAYLTTAMLSNAATISNVKISAGTLSANRSDLTFADSNGISFGLNTNGILTATVVTNYQSSGAYLTTADLSQNSSKYAGINFAGTNISGTLNTSGLSLSVAAPGGGGGYNLQYFEADDVQGMGLMTNITGLNTRPIFIPFILKGSLTNNSLILQVSRSTSGSNAFTLQAGLYTYGNSTSIGSIGSLSAAFSGSNTASFSGVRYLVATGWGTGATALTPGAYVLVLNFSANGGNTASMNYSLFGGVTASAPVGFIAQGSDQANTSNTTWGPANFWGRYTVGSAALPAAAGQTDILADFTGASQPVAPWFILRP